MKTKPVSHKTTNLFKFQTFSERISSIHIDVIHKIHDNREALPDEEDTFFCEACIKLRDLNYTSSFTDFLSELGDECQTLAQVYHHKDRIIDLLKKYLDNSHRLAHEPVLELVVALARDLQYEFYPHFMTFLTCITKLITTFHHDEELLQSCFNTLAYLYKFLWRYINKDLSNILQQHSYLLQDAQPEHIGKFAAQSMGFLMRKLVKGKREVYLTRILTLASDDKCVDGCGNLVFEIVKGVVGQLHSKHADVLTFLLLELGNPSHGDNAVNVLQIAFQLIASHVEPKYNSSLWELLFGCIEATVSNEDHVMRILELLMIFTTHRHGHHIDKTDGLVGCLKLLNSKLVNSEAHGTALLTHVVKVMLLIQNKVSVECFVSLARQVIDGCWDCKFVFAFVRDISPSSLFISHLLPLALQYTHTQIEGLVGASAKTSILVFLAELVLRNRPLPRTREEAVDWQPYPLNFLIPLHRRKTKTGVTVPGFLASCLEADRWTEVAAGASVNVCNSIVASAKLAALIVLPHIRPIDVCACAESCRDMVANIHSALTGVRAEDTMWMADIAEAQLVQLLVTALQTIFLLRMTDDSVSWYDDQFVLDVLERYPHNVHVLRLVELHLWRKGRDGELSPDFLPALYQVVMAGLYHQSAQVRFYSGRTLGSAAGSEVAGIFKAIGNAESVRLSVETYRERVRWLQKLNYQTVTAAMEDNQQEWAQYQAAAVFHVCGQFQEQFRLLWVPCREILLTYAHGMKADVFWNIFQQVFSYASATRDSDEKEGAVEPQQNVTIGLCDQLNKHWIAKEEVRDQRLKFRSQLLKAMGSFADVCEVKNRFVVPIFLDFVEREYCTEDVSSWVQEDLARSEHNLDETEAEDEVPEDVDRMPRKRKQSRRTGKSAGRSEILSTLLSFLEIFSKFQNPRSVHKEAELRAFLEECLRSRNLTIQKLSFQCLMTYQPAHILPYRDAIEKVMSSDQLRHSLFELGQIKIQADHREEMITVVLRILIGMLNCAPPPTKQVIMSYFGTLHPEELRILWDLMFNIFDHYSLDGVSLKECERFADEVDVHKCFPIKRQQAILRYLQLIFDKLGSLMAPHLNRFVKYLLTMAIIDCVVIQKHVTGDCPLPTSVLRAVRFTRNLVIETLVKFYESFDEYDWSEEEEAVVMKYLVTPQLGSLPLDGIHSPTAMMKLFVEWSRNSRYFSLFQKNSDILPQIFRLRQHPQCDQSVVSCISRVLRNLLTLDAMDERFGGSRLITAMMDEMLEYLDLVIKRLHSGALSEDDTMIMLRVTSLVPEKTSFQRMLDVLMPAISRRASPPVTPELLQCIDKMLRHVKAPRDYLGHICWLFRKVRDYATRLALCGVLKTMCVGDHKLSEMAANIEDINMNDPTRLEEPDYDRRIHGYTGLDAAIQANHHQGDINLLLTVIYNCHFMLMNYDDMAIQDRSVATIGVCLDHISGLHDNRLGEVASQLLDCVKIGLESPEEARRHQYVAVLSEMVTKCHESHTILKELHQLQDDDEEVDFFTNLRHMQTHRRARALKRVSVGVARDTYHFSNATVSEVLLRTASVFLFEEKYVKFEHLIESAISLMGTLAGKMGWKPYMALVQQYMGQLASQEEHQKQAVKLVCCLLDHFHWDVDTNPKIVESIRNTLLPWLQKMLTVRVRAEVEHKMNLRHQEEDSVLKRIPLTIAVVKLMKLLPDDVIASELPIVLLKVCQFLKSRADSVRDVARKTLVSVMTSLGPKYLSCLIGQLRGLLIRGYQVHVMTHTLHHVLKGMSEALVVGDTDPCYRDILEVVKDELFGQTAAEKEVRQITTKIPEARSNKSWDMMGILGRCTSRDLILKLLEPFCELLGATSQHSKVSRIQQCLASLAQGLAENTALDAKAYLVFTHGVVSGSMVSVPRKAQSEEVVTDSRRPDTFLIPPDPRKKAAKPKVAEKTNDHVLVEFGLQLFSTVVKKNKIQLSRLDDEEKTMMDPIVKIMVDFVKGEHPKVTTFALKCLNWVIRQDVSLVAHHTDQLVPLLFVILHQYCGCVTTQDNLEMITAAFKCTNNLLLKCDSVKVTKKQLRILLTYIELDIKDQKKQATAFDLLRTILRRKLVCPELTAFMNALKELSITSEVPHIRGMARQVFLYYLLNYPLGNKVKSLVNFYMGQLEYEYESGRTSALEMLSSMVDNIPPKMLEYYSPEFFITLSTCLVNDESDVCRKMAAITLSSLIGKAAAPEREKLFDMVVTWMEDDVVGHQKLGVQLLGLFCDIEKSDFRRRFPRAKPLILAIMSPPEAERTDVSETAQDQLLFQTLRTLLKVAAVLPGLLLADSEFWETLQGLLRYPHLWVRHSANQLFGQLFSSSDVKALSGQDGPSDNYLLADSRDKVLRLSGDFVHQMKADSLSEEMMDQLVKNLVYLARVALHLVCLKTRDLFTLKLMIDRMTRIARNEVASASKSPAKRSAVFKWLAAVALEFPRNDVDWESWCGEYLGVCLPTLVREIDDPFGNAEIKTLAQEVTDMLKAKMPAAVFTRVYSSAHHSLIKKKRQMKTEKSQTAVTRPEVFARAKVKKQQAKVKSKKRKIEARQEVGGKRHKLRDMAFVTC